MSTIAFALRADYATNYTGGVIAVGYDRTLDIKAEIETGGGQIVVPDNDPSLLLALDGYPALKRVTAGDSDVTVDDRYEAMSVSDLRAEAKSLGVEKTGTSRDSLLAALRGNNDPAGSGQEG